MSDNLVLVASACYLIISEEKRKAITKRRKKRRWWMTSLFKSRSIYRGIDLIKDLQVEREYGLFENFCRMKCTDFEFLFNRVGPKISKEITSFRDPIPAKERFMLTLRYLATGDSYTSLMYTFKISKQLISRIVPEVCQAVIESLQEYVKIPSTSEEWLLIAERFEIEWNFRHCLGAIDGKHCLLQAPINSGSDYFNYKQNFSIVLLGIADADYCFLFADVGCQGRLSDGGVLKQTYFWKKLHDNELNLPPDEPIGRKLINVPYVFIGDDAFSLQEHLLKAYPVEQKKGSIKRIFNYRLCRARRVIENVFGIMSSIFRVLRKPILLSPEKATKVVLACTFLHNFLRKSTDSRNIYTPAGTFDENREGEVVLGTWRQEYQSNGQQSFLPLKKIPRKSAAYCELIRNRFAEYFSDEGSVVWQGEYA